MNNRIKLIFAALPIFLSFVNYAHVIELFNGTGRGIRINCITNTQRRGYKS